MPYEIRKQGSKYCVYKTGDSEKKIGCHSSRKKAREQQKALYAKEDDTEDVMSRIQFGQGGSKKQSVRLTKDGKDEHIHNATLDEKGNGVSTKTNGHTHVIVNGKVKKAEGHTHKIQKS